MSVEKKLQDQSHSGATLKVIRKENETTLVEKIIHHDIDRNRRAIEKQRNFKTYLTSSYIIKSIPIENIENGKDLRIEMPYIEGIGGDVFAIHGSKQTAIELKSTLNSYLIDSLSRAEVVKFNKNIILDKINSIEKAHLSDCICKAVGLAIIYAKKICEKELYIPILNCHGDLTLSNMIITNNTLYVFDFLDSFIESPLQDAAKLIQDMRFGWSFRKQNGSIKLKGQLFCETAYPNIIETFKKMYPNEMDLLEVITILRIAPYINQQDHLTHKWFNDTIESILGE